MNQLADGPLATLTSLPVAQLHPNRLSRELYGDPDQAPDLDGLRDSIVAQGILVPLVVTPRARGGYQLVSGHRRWSCALLLGIQEAPCEIRSFPSKLHLERALIAYNRYRRKTFSQMMREADALEASERAAAQRRRLANLKPRVSPGSTTTDPEPDRAGFPERRKTDAPGGRTDSRVARAIGLGSKDTYRQARALWQAACSGDQRAHHSVRQLDQETKTIHSAYKDLRRRDRFTSGFRPTPYDVWSFRHDPAYGVSHPGSIPAAIVAHLVHYFTEPNALVVDPMAGGGTTLDVCAAMGRRCLAYDLEPVRDEIRRHDVNAGFPLETRGCDLIFCDPPYHSMLAGAYGPHPGAVSDGALSGWLAFLDRLAAASYQTLRPGGVLAVLLANQTEKDLPRGFGYLDHAFFCLSALLRAGFLPERRVSCPMSGGYLPQQVQKARAEGRLLGLVRDLLIVRRPVDPTAVSPALTALLASPPHSALGSPEASS